MCPFKPRLYDESLSCIKINVVELPMLQWMLNLPCKVGWHDCTWVYDSGTVKCAQIMICRRCNEQFGSSVVRHDHRTWVYDAPAQCTQTSICLICGEKGSKVRHDYRTWEYKGPMNCTQTRTCQRCAEQRSRVLHDMHWKSDGVFSRTDSSVCTRCELLLTRHKPSPNIGPGGPR